MERIDTTFAVVKRKPEKNQACTGFETYDLCDTGAALNLAPNVANKASGSWSFCSMNDINLFLFRPLDEAPPEAAT